MNEVEITLTGNVSLDPQRHQTRTGEHFLSFRVAVNERRYDQGSGGYVDGAASFYRVVAWKQLARHLDGCLCKGDPVIVRGVLRINEWTATNGQARSTPEVTAYHVGHDLAFGEGSFRRVSRSAPPGQVAPGGSTEAVGPVARTDGTDADGAQSAA
ncbi:single-stranded DNA-binding protein [Allobranchiibius sp. GilTou38]|uniref:single-stranded DNA-binding protein n=1 Tax=Allobranchiibius sp. GilTou38 TaxID=2815210 RepID=UPI001AA1B13B|nr:single-stranded DNA-binding protein [Allobranchiibius sp. GilTou38]MBO1767702.1 single-stranded DNA-binding protein [Allobranchiibius sp. GilTou38]